MTSRRLFSFLSYAHRHILRLALVVVLTSNVFAGTVVQSPARGRTAHLPTGEGSVRDYFRPNELTPDKGVVRRAITGSPSSLGTQLSTSSVFSPHQITYSSFG